MKYLYLMLVLFALPVCAQDVVESTGNPKADTVVEPPRVRVMPFLPYTGSADLEYRKRKSYRSGGSDTVSYAKDTTIQERTYGVVFDEGSIVLNPAAIEKIKQAAEKLQKTGTNNFILISYYREGDSVGRSLAYRRLKIVNNALFDAGLKRTFQSYAYSRKQIITNKDTVIIVPR